MGRQRMAQAPVNGTVSASMASNLRPGDVFVNLLGRRFRVEETRRTGIDRMLLFVVALDTGARETYPVRASRSLLLS